MRVSGCSGMAQVHYPGSREIKKLGFDPTAPRSVFLTCIKYVAGTALACVFASRNIIYTLMP